MNTTILMAMAVEAYTIAIMMAMGAFKDPWDVFVTGNVLLFMVALVELGKRVKWI